MRDTVLFSWSKKSATQCALGAQRKNACFLDEWDFNRQLPPPPAVMLPRCGPPRSGPVCSFSSP